MINFDYEIKNTPPINIRTLEFNKYDISKEVRSSIALYNQSIIQIKSECIDLAIDSLKKSLHYNSSFYEAMKLLGLCYAYKKEYSKAEKILKKLADYPMYTEQANSYLENIKIEKTTFKALEAIRNVNSIGDKYEINTPTPHRFSAKRLIVPALLLLTIGGSSVYAYLMRADIHITISKFNNISFKKVEIEEPKTDIVQKQDEAVTEKYTQLLSDNSNLQKNLENTKTELDNYKNRYTALILLNDAEKFISSDNYEKTLDNLLELKNLDLDDTSKTRFNKLWNDLRSNGMWSIYKQGSDLFKSGKYSEALPKLRKVQEIMPDPELLPWIIYQVGVCYKETGDSKDALDSFQKVKADYPNSQYAGYSDRMLQQMNNKNN